MLLSDSITSSMLSAKPAIASSIALSTISQTRWCMPSELVVPIYIPGRLRSASKPSSTWIWLASYCSAKSALYSCSLSCSTLIHSPFLSVRPVYEILLASPVSSFLLHQGLSLLRKFGLYFEKPSANASVFHHPAPTIHRPATGRDTLLLLPALNQFRPVSHLT